MEHGSAYVAFVSQPHNVPAIRVQLISQRVNLEDSLLGRSYDLVSVFLSAGFISHADIVKANFRVSIRVFTYSTQVFSWQTGFHGKRKGTL